MKNILCFLLTFINCYIYTPIRNDIIDVYTSKENAIQNEFIKVSNNKVAFYYQGNYLFSYESEDDNILDLFDYEEIDNNLHIVINDNGEILYYKFNELGKKVIEENIDDYNSINKIKIFYDNENINIVFNSIYSLKDYQKQLNICILKLDSKGKEISVKTYGGYLNEEIMDLFYKDNNLYLFLKRDNMSGKDFNNFGNYVLSIIRDEEIVENVFFSDESFQNIIFSLDEIRLSFNEGIYSFDYDLNQKLGLKFSLESTYSLVSFNKMRMEIEEDKAKIYDLFDNSLLYEYDFSEYLLNYYLKKFYILDNSIYLIFSDFDKETYLKIDAFDTRDFVKEITYIDGISQYNNQIDAWNGLLNTEINDKDFNPSVDGEYEIEYKFLNYSKKMNVKVLEYQNVSEGNIYPLLYELEFSGTAFLNGKMIDYGYKLNKSGRYCLELYNAKKEKREINFIVSSDQIYFSENFNKKADYVISKNSSLYLKYSTKENDLIVDKVIVDGEEWKFYEYKNNVLTLEIYESEMGFKYHNIEKIIFETKEGKKFVQIIDEIVTLLVLNENPKIDIIYENSKENISFDFNISNGSCIRYLNIYSDGILLKQQHLKDGMIYLDDKLNNAKEISFYLVYDLGDGNLYEYELFNLEYIENSFYDIGEINISFLETELEEFKLVINKNKYLSKVKFEEEILYERLEKDYSLVYIFLTLFVIIFVICSIRYMKENKNKKAANDNYSLKKI